MTAKLARSVLVPVFPVSEVTAAPTLLLGLDCSAAPALFFLLLLLVGVPVSATTSVRAIAAGTCAAALDGSTRISEAATTHRWHRFGEAIEASRFARPAFF